VKATVFSAIWWLARGTAPKRQINIHGSSQKFGAMFAVVPQQVTDQHAGHVRPGNCRGPAGADCAHRVHTQLSIDQDPVAEGVDDVCADQCERHGLHHVHGLQAAAHGEIEKKREESSDESFAVGNRKRQDAGIDLHSAKKRRKQPDRGGEERC
jgi:hypothetical protein